jgi:hypothetical protein
MGTTPINKLAPLKSYKKEEDLHSRWTPNPQPDQRVICTLVDLRQRGDDQEDQLPLVR